MEIAMDEIEKQCNEALEMLRAMAAKIPHDSNIVCQALIELAAEYEDSGFLENLHGRVNGAVMRIKHMIGETDGKHAQH
jgi:hypothetical protein